MILKDLIETEQTHYLQMDPLEAHLEATVLHHQLNFSLVRVQAPMKEYNSHHDVLFCKTDQGMSYNINYIEVLKSRGLNNTVRKQIKLIYLNIYSFSGTIRVEAFFNVGRIIAHSMFFQST